MGSEEPVARFPLAPRVHEAASPPEDVPMKTLFGFGAVMALAMTSLACGKSAEPPPSTLEVTGKVDTRLRTLDNASAVAISSDGRTYSAYIQKNGTFRLSLPVGHVYRVIFANSTMAGELRTIGHLINTTSSGKFDQIAVKEGGTMSLGTVRPVGTSPTSLKTACNCGSTGSGESSDSDKSGSDDHDDKDSDHDGKDKDKDGDFGTKDKDGDKDRLCEDSSDVELEAEHGPGDKCAKDDSDEEAPKASKKSCSSKDSDHDGKDDDDDDKGSGGGGGKDDDEGGGSGAGEGSSSSSGGGGADSCSTCAPKPPASCTCSKQCGAGSSCVASKCSADASGSPDGTSSSGSTPPK